MGVLKGLMENPIILIPARLAATRLPNKPLAQIAGLPMIVQVMRRAQEADCARVVVAAGERDIADAVTAHGGEAVLTDPDLPSGSDRIFQALRRLEEGGGKKYDAIINVQGDLPTLDPQLIRRALAILPQGDIATLVAEISDVRERDNPNVVKAVLSFTVEAKSAAAKIGRALYFTRAAAPSGAGVLYHHIGLYAYHRAALEQFVALPPSPLEQRERLEQLRALEAGMKIVAACVDTVPLGVDTPEDLALANRRLAGQAEREKH